MSVKDRYFYGAGAVALAAAIAFGAVWDRQLRPAAPGAAALTGESVESSYEDALEVVMANYAGPYEVEEVNKTAILGMLRTLDPHSAYFDAREFSELRNEQQSQLVGIGVTINMRNGRVHVLS